MPRTKYSVMSDMIGGIKSDADTVRAAVKQIAERDTNAMYLSWVPVLCPLSGELLHMIPAEQRRTMTKCDLCPYAIGGYGCRSKRMGKVDHVFYNYEEYTAAEIIAAAKTWLAATDAAKAIIQRLLTEGES